jgi:peptide/nickel transport system ATP-binding protein
VLDDIAEHAGSNDETAALATYTDAFGSVCDAEPPAYYTVSDSGRQSLCHLHDEEFRPPEEVLEARHR